MHLSSNYSEAPIDRRTRCLMVHDHKVLVLIRDFTSDKTLLLPGGGIDPGESSLDAVKREMKEELDFFCSKPPTFFYTHQQIRPIFAEEREWFIGKEYVHDYFDFYFLKLDPSNLTDIRVVQSEHEKFEAWGFVGFSSVADYAQKYNAKMGIGVLDAIDVYRNRFDR